MIGGGGKIENEIIFSKGMIDLFNEVRGGGAKNVACGYQGANFECVRFSDFPPHP